MSKIVNISEAASIAMHGMLMIAKADSVVNVNKIAEFTKSSRHHAAKVMQRLVKDNFVISQRGPKGGFILKKTADEINFLDIFESIEGKIEIKGCPVGKETCMFSTCFLQDVTHKMSIDFHDYLKKTKLSDYL